MSADYVWYQENYDRALGNRFEIRLRDDRGKGEPIAICLTSRRAEKVKTALNSHARLVEGLGELAETVFFFASCIKAGDHWSDKCEEALVRARALIKEHSHDEG